MYIPLRSHSHFSLLEAVPKIDEMVKKAIEYGYPAMAITDTDNMYGAIEFYKECKKKGIKPILATELNVLYDSHKYKLAVYAKNEVGYRTLLKLVSKAQMNDFVNPHLKDIDLLLLNENVIIICDNDILLDHISTLHLLNKDDIYFEIRNDTINKITSNEELNFNNEKSELLKKGHIQNKYKLVATQHSRYMKIEDKESHRVMLNIHNDADSEERYKAIYKPYDLHFISPATAKEWFKDYQDALKNCIEIADKCNVELVLGKWYFPKIDSIKSPEEDLTDLVYAGIDDRGMDANDIKLQERIKYELDVIKEKGFAIYFLVVYDLLRFAHENKILTNIRGSVAGSMVTYLLRITNCDPFFYKLPFERFLNRERPSAPDIDMDYADDRRDEVLDYARRKYGKDNVAQIGTFGAMLARGAVRDVARALKYPYIVGDRISRMIPPPRQGFPVTIDMAIAEVPELKKAYEEDRETAHILDMSRKLEGCVRHVSVHAAGTVIAPSDVSDFAPIQWDPKGEKIITQYEMNAVGEDNVGLLKYDFLGIRNLSILATAIEIVKAEYNIDIDIEQIPIDDKKTFDMLARGETVGLFQLNGGGMTKFLKELRPTTIFDINAMVALYRPGPLEMIPEYIRRKHDSKLIVYTDPRLESILDQSFGVIVYQDDVMLTAIHLAGYSWLQADKLRKAMGKKIPAEMQEQKEKLMKGFLTNGLSKIKAVELWTQIEPFAAYGFNKAHAASYGRVAYQTAYMKANFPYAYMTAIMTHESGDVDKINEIVSECKRMNISVLPPDINFSDSSFTIVKNSNGKEEIRFGLLTIKNLGHDIAKAIMIERKENGIYKNLEDFIGRVKHNNLNKRSIEALAKCGAMDSLIDRSIILANIEGILEYHKAFVKDTNDQGSLFDIAPSTFNLKQTSLIDIETKLSWERELLGLYVSGFPLDPWKDKIAKREINIGLIQSGGTSNVVGLSDGTEVSIPVLIEKVKIMKTKKGDRMALITVRDYTGAIDLAIFPDTYEKYKNKCIVDKVAIIKGKISTRNSEKNLIVEEIKDIARE